MRTHTVFGLTFLAMTLSQTNPLVAQPSELDPYITPASVPVRALHCTESFQGLTENEKLYAHWMTRASWNGALICFEQVSPESPAILEFLMLFHAKDQRALRRAATRRGVSDADLEAFEVYSARFLSNTGNYLSFGDTKFIPRIPVERLSVLVEAAATLDGPRDERLLDLFDEISLPLYSLDPTERALGLGKEGVSGYYDANVTADDIEFIKRYMVDRGIEAWNTRVAKDSHGVFTLKVASVEEWTKDDEFEDRIVTLAYGDFSRTLARVNAALRRALHHASNETQRQMIRKYIEHFTTGNVGAHKDSQRFWVQDKGPAVETNLGFIETYRDPVHVRAEWEGLVAVVDKAQSQSFQALVSRGADLVKRLPWGARFEKDRFKEPDFTSLDVLAFANGGIPAGINIPNYDEIRMNEGFKNVSLGNVISAGDASTERIDFIDEADQDLYRRLQNKAFKVQVGLHELLGHGSGKMFVEEADGQRNFDPSIVNPLDGKPVATWYRAGQTWGSVFGKIASSYEECRAEAVGLHLCGERDVLALFGHDGAESEDIVYINWLSMARAGVASLTFYNPETKVWGQAHMQARFALLQVMLEAGDDFVKIVTTDDGHKVVVLDRKKIKTVGHPAVARFLEKLGVFKATADIARGQALYDAYTSVTGPLLDLRQYVVAQRKPRHLWVQPVTDLDAMGRVILRTHPATYRGVIDSFLDRYADPVLD